MASYQITAPEVFDFKPETWPSWFRRFQRFRIASGLSQRNEEEQVNTFIYLMGDKADDIFNTFTLVATDKKKYKPVSEAFDKYFDQKCNVMFERAKFNQRRQQEGEPVDQFITELYNLPEHCGYGALKDEMLRDRIVVGLADRKLSEKLQLDPELTLEKALTSARQSEIVKKQQVAMRQEVDLEHRNQPRQDNIDAIQGTNVRNTGRPRPGPRPTDSWQKCGRRKHPQGRCRAQTEECYKCGKVGHYMRECRSGQKDNRPRARVGLVHAYDHEESEVGPVQPDDATPDAFLGSIETDAGREVPWMVDVEIGNGTLQFKLDTGADVTVVPERLYNETMHGRISPSDKILHGPADMKIPVMGKIHTTLSVNKKKTQVVYIIKGGGKPLLGKPAIQALNIVQATVNNVQESTEKIDFVQRFPNVFTGLGEMDGEYDIKLLEEDVKPYVLNTPRRIPIPLMNKTKIELDRMMKLNVIVPVKEATQWCSGMVVVPKDNGDLRICADFTKLNNCVMRERYILPTVEHTLGQLAGAKIFSKLDANSGFWQLKLSEESSLLTTFITTFGRFRYLRLSYGITSAPEHFQRRMLEVLEGLEVWHA